MINLQGLAMPESVHPSPSEGTGLTFSQLEAGYLTYCKALRMLIAEGTALKKIQRTHCWHRLEMLHRMYPRQYRDPLVHYNMTKRSVEADRCSAA